ncbi:hypothetical protein C8R47DRAFT_1075535 [Mycena vitilis]|nr:hypothetical protein C8R47DRAFT_1075535 [Mycena vitilis]
MPPRGLCLILPAASSSMAYLLSSFSPMVKAGQYNVEFAATRFSSTNEAAGSVYIFRPLDGPSDFFRGHNMRPGMPMQPMVVAGCVVDMEQDSSVPEQSTFYITLGLPLFASSEGRKISASQIEFLAQIAEMDIRSAEAPCTAQWGSPRRHVETPTVVVRCSASTLVGFNSPFEIGEDFIFKTSLQRFESTVGGRLLMRYAFVGGTFGHLRPDQLSVPFAHANLRPTMSIHQLLMSFGTRALALAKYETDFIAVRQRSVLGGSAFAFKSIPCDDDSGYIGLKGQLWNYICVIFGEVDEVHSVRGHGDFIRIRCPDYTFCSVKKLFAKQGDTLLDILGKDNADIVRATLTISRWCTNIGPTSRVAVSPTPFSTMGSSATTSRQSQGAST